MGESYFEGERTEAEVRAAYRRRRSWAKRVVDEAAAALRTLDVADVHATLTYKEERLVRAALVLLEDVIENIARDEARWKKEERDARA